MLTNIDGFWVAVLYPSVARVLWSCIISFMILATTTQFESGEKLFKYKNCNEKSNMFYLVKVQSS